MARRRAPARGLVPLDPGELTTAEASDDYEVIFLRHGRRTYLAAPIDFDEATRMILLAVPLSLQDVFVAYDAASAFNVRMRAVEEPEDLDGR